MDPDKKVTLEVVRRAEKELDSIPTMPFTSSAFKLLTGKISQYISNLVIESIRTSKRNRTDNISATHVEEASANISYRNRRNFSRHLGIISGILIGLAFSKMLIIINQGSVSTLDYVITAACGIIGAILLGFHMANN